MSKSDSTKCPPPDPHKLTMKEARRALAWFRRMTGFHFRCLITIGEKPPEWVEGTSPGNAGQCLTMRQARLCQIWIKPSGGPQYDIDVHIKSSALQTLFHELMHAFYESCGLDEFGPDQDWAADAMGRVCLAAYNAEMG